MPDTLTDYVLALMACMAWQSPPTDDACARLVELAVEPDAALDFSMTDAALCALFELGRKAVA